MKNFLLSVPEAVHKALKVHCVNKGIPMGKWIAAAIVEKLEREGVAINAEDRGVHIKENY